MLSVSSYFHSGFSLISNPAGGRGLTMRGTLILDLPEKKHIIRICENTRKPATSDSIQDSNYLFLLNFIKCNN